MRPASPLTRCDSGSQPTNRSHIGWSEQLNLVTEHGADLDAAAMWRALETEIGPRDEVESAASLLDDDRALPAPIAGPADRPGDGGRGVPWSGRDV